MFPNPCIDIVHRLLVHRYRTARARISARPRSNIKMAERPMEPQAFNMLTSFYKNKGFKPKNPSKSVFVSWLYDGMSEMKDGNKFSAPLWWKTGEKKTKQNKKKKNNYRSNLAIRKEETFLFNSAAVAVTSTLYLSISSHFLVKMSTLPCCGRHIGCHFVTSPILRRPN